MLPGKGGEIAPETMKMLNQSRNDTLLWTCLVVKGKSSAVKNSCTGTRNVRSMN